MNKKELADYSKTACLVVLLSLASPTPMVNADGPNGSGEGKSLSANPESELGMDTEALDRMEKIADGFRQRGFYSDAEAILQDVFEIRRKKHGPNDPEMAYYHNNLGLLQAEQGKSAEAEGNYLRAVAITEKHWGPNHPDLADELNNLAGIYRSRARFAEAEALYKRAVAVTETALGPNHPDAVEVRGGYARLAFGRAEQKPTTERSQGSDASPITGSVVEGGVH